LKILLLNQTFHPDVMASAQYLTQLVCALAGRGHDVTVVTSRRAYDQPAMQFPARETWRGIIIHRVSSTAFGKSAKWRRAADSASFMLACCWRLVTLPRQDVVLALTSPPLISFVGAWLARFRGSRFVYWVLDFNPDEAIAAGWLRPDSFGARVLERMSRFSLRRAHKVIALDRFMRDRIVAKEVPGEKVAVLPPWSQDDHVHYDAAGRERFRAEHGLLNKFVVVYSGNHSPIHPLETLLEAARRLMGEQDMVFCFIGGGSEFERVRQLAGKVRNLYCLPYQPLEQLSALLSAADLHVVVMGNSFVGLVHPCKIYNILGVGAPVLYIGPQPSHVTEIFDAAQGGLKFYSAVHSDVEGLVAQILKARAESISSDQQTSCPLPSRFSKETLLPRLIAELESV